MTLDEILSRLSSVTRTATGATACCPAHADHRASLSVGVGRNGRILLRCHAGCTTEAIVAAMGITMRDLFGDDAEASRRGDRGEIVATYDYCDEEGRILYQVVRFEPKDFKQRRREGAGWTWKIGNVRRVPYRLPELIARPGARVFVVEGEKDVDNLEKLGFLATTNAGGAGKWKTLDAETVNRSLGGRDVVVIPDNDDPGRAHALDVAKRLTAIGCTVRVVELSGLAEKGDVSDWIAAGGTLEKLLEIVEATPIARAISLPRIVCTARQLRDKTVEALAALVQNNDPPSIFVRGKLVRVRCDENGRPVIDALTLPAICGLLTRAADFIDVRSSRAGDVLRDRDPPRSVAEDLLSMADWPFPPLEGIVETPTVRPDGSILSVSGYDPVTRLYYAPPRGFVLPHVADEPSSDEAAAALKFIDEGIGEFPFVDKASHANTLAALLTPVVRSAITGPTPIGLVDKPTKGTGASLLCELISVIATDRMGPLRPAPETDEEWRKTITSNLLEGSAILILDNIDRSLASASLAAALTATYWKDRVLGKSENTIALPVRMVWLATGNNISLRGDIARRAYWIRLDAKVSEPWKRTGFTHPNLLEWASSARPRILHALLTLVRRWVAIGKPSPASGVPIMGGFESWRQTIGGILSAVGLGEHFLGNADALHATVDEETGEWESFLQSIHDLSGESSFTTRKAVEWIKDPMHNLAEKLPTALADAFEEKKKSPELKLSRAFRRKLDVRHGESQIRVTRGSGDLHAKICTWKILAGVAGTAGVLNPHPAGPTLSYYDELYEKKCDGDGAKTTPAAPATPANDHQVRPRKTLNPPFVPWPENTEIL